MADIHDSGYKLLFSNRTIFRQLIETFVPEPWVKEADFDRAEPVDKSFVAEHYKHTESDLIYRVPLGKGSVYIYVLLEFQSTVDRFMALRVLHYLSSFYLDYVRSGHRRRRLPPVFPIVLYNGDRQWTAPTRLDELIERHEQLGRFGVQFEYFKIAENEFSRAHLLQIRNIVSTLFLAETQYDIKSLTEELMGLFERAEDRQAVSLFINWFRQMAAHGRVSSDDYEVLSQVYASQEEVQSMLIKALEEEKKKVFEEGKLEGKLEGLNEGKLEGKLEGLNEGKRTVARQMLAEGMPVATVARLTGLSEEEIRALES